MENHLAYRGDDNFAKYVGNAFGLSSRAKVRARVTKRCSVHWLEIPDLQNLYVMEHLAIAALAPVQSGIMFDSEGWFHLNNCNEPKQPVLRISIESWNGAS